MVLAEAGVEDGMAFINEYAGNNAGSQNWADTANADGWDINGNVYHVQRTPDPTLGCYDVWVTNNLNAISVCAVGTAAWNQQPITGPQVPSAAPGIATSGMDLGTIVRQVLVQTTNDPLFSVAHGLHRADQFERQQYLNADSFDSSDTNHSVWNTNLPYGVYSPALRKANSVLATDAGITNVSVPGNLSVYGSINTGPGGETNAQQNGSVGDMTWVPTPGIQAGHSQDDMNVTFQKVSLPPANPSQIGPITSRYSLSNTGYYEDSENGGLDHSVAITAPNVVLYLVNGLAIWPWQLRTAGQWQRSRQCQLQPSRHHGHQWQQHDPLRRRKRSTWAPAATS